MLDFSPVIPQGGGRKGSAYGFEPELGRKMPKMVDFLLEKWYNSQLDFEAAALLRLRLCYGAIEQFCTTECCEGGPMAVSSGSYTLPHEEIQACIKAMDEAHVPLEGRMLSFLAHDYETDGEALDRVRRTYYDAQYDRIMADLASVQQDHKPRYFATEDTEGQHTDLWAHSPWRIYCRPVEFIFRPAWLAYDAVCMYDDHQGHRGSAVLMIEAEHSSPWFYEDMMSAARAVRCYADEESS